ncbi:MAG TPA: aminopeptidase, partial [Thermoleophilia bacterium]|nr:aminopeptidase [Thermoleophilia bacterium]
RAVARRIVRECAGVSAGEDVYIEGRLDSAVYLELLAFECELVGGRPIVVMQSDEHILRRLTELPEEQLATKAQPWIDATKAADVVFSVHMEDGDPALFSAVPAAKLGAMRRGRKLLADHIYDGSRRWIGTDFPSPAQARAYGVPWEAFAETFWRALDVDYRLLQERAGRVCAVLEKAQTVRVRSPKGTDLTMRIAGRPVDQDVGVVSAATPLSNLPAGEVCLAPLEDGADGRVVFDLAFWDGRRIEDLEVEFERGRCRARGAAQGLEIFTGTLASASGAADVIAELGIGLNPEVTEATGFMLTDEKILGTVHIAVGENRILGGVNESSLHWDLLVMQASLEADGVPILQDGRLVV